MNDLREMKRYDLIVAIRNWHGGAVKFRNTYFPEVRDESGRKPKRSYYKRSHLGFEDPKKAVAEMTNAIEENKGFFAGQQMLKNQRRTALIGAIGRHHGGLQALGEDIFQMFQTFCRLKAACIICS